VYPAIRLSLLRSLMRVAYSSHSSFFFLIILRPPRSTLFPYTTLFRSVVAAIRAAETATAQYNLMTLTIAVGYGGRGEIADAVRGFVKMQARQGASLSDVIERITPEAIACHLYAADLPDPDFIIPTSGEIRFSGFLLLQSVH